MKKRQRPALKIPTPASMAHVALHYLSRYAASEASLRRVLQNRIRRVARENSDFVSDLETQSHIRNAIETIIEAHKKTGALNDMAFAETKVNSLRRSGRSKRAIQQKLIQKGVSKETVAAAFAERDDEDEMNTGELKAARYLAKRRHLGCFRQGETDKARYIKDVAILARAGFSLDTARKVLGENTSFFDD